MTLTKNAISVFIKNTSTVVIAYGRNEGDYGVKIFYVDNKGAKVPLRDYYNHDDDVTESVHEDISIESGKTICASFFITPEELTLLNLHPVSCSFTIYHPSDWKHQTTVESSLKTLTVTVVK